MKKRTKGAPTLFCGDCLEVMRQFPNGAFDLVITSPPYNMRNSAGGFFKQKTNKSGMWTTAKLQKGYECHDDNMPHEEYVAWQRECLKEMLRLIPEDGAIFYNHKWRVQNGLLQDRQDIVRGFPVRQIIIWSRTGGFNFNPGYFLPTYEVIYLIAKKKFKLAAKANAVGDVWTFAPARNNPHPAPFPMALTDRIVSSTTAQRILDPFCGSGTVGLSCRKYGRQFVGIDKSQSYLDMAKKRMEGNENETKHHRRY